MAGMPGFSWNAGRDMNALSDQMTATADATAANYGAVTGGNVNFSDDGGMKWIAGGLLLVALVWLERKRRGGR